MTTHFLSAPPSFYNSPLLGHLTVWPHMKFMLRSAEERNVLIMKVIVLGAGPGGYEAALYAAKRGHEVTLIEKNKLGGTCLNCGCIPTKALLACSDVLYSVQVAKDFGIQHEGASVSFQTIMTRKAGIVNGLVNGIGFLMGQNHVNVVNGYGRLAGAGAVEVELADGTKETYTADKIILATGSTEAVPPIFPYDGVNVITSKEVLELDELPESIAIVGGGVIGCEVGQFLARLGSKVTIIEMMEHVLPAEDKDVARVLNQSLKKDGATVLCGVAVQSMEVADGSVAVKLSNGETVVAKKALIAIGRKPNTRDIGLETVGIKTNERGFIPVSAAMETNVENIYAIGDIVPSAQLAHVASKEGFVAVDHLSGKENVSMTYHAIPRCVYTDPEVAAVGITEDAAKKQGLQFTKGTFDFTALGKAKAAGKTNGFAKVLADENGVIVGASIVGAHASDMLSMMTLAVELGLTVDQVNSSIFPHPSMSEAIMEAVHDTHKLSVHKL